jgi:catechol 2,3-dioxygenase-like lactoylglutathione lyase family enzyme
MQSYYDELTQKKVNRKLKLFLIMKIFITSVFVDDQAKALKFYTEVLGFVKKTDQPAGQYRWLTVVSPDGSADIELLLNVIHALVDEGNTVVVIEHNLSVIAEADYIVDIGPEAGADGGQIVAFGTPEEVAKNRLSRTAPFLRDILAPKNGAAATGTD